MYVFKFPPAQSFSPGILLNQAWASWKIFIYLKTSKVNVLFMNWIEVLTVQSTPNDLIISLSPIGCNEAVIAV